jgi:RNA polymerase sigma factor (sigma-70 family)
LDLYLNCFPLQYMFLKLKKRTASPVLEDLSDEQLVSGYLEKSDKDLIAVLFERYTHLVYGICLNYLQDPDQCKDAVMEIFEGLFHKLSEHHVSNFRNWLYSVTRNHCLMTIRRRGSFQRATLGMQPEQDENEFPQYGTEEDDLTYSKKLILSAVDQLNAEQSTCIRLMYLDDKSYRDISGITGFSLNEVKSHIQNGKRNLKNYLLKQNGNAEI